MSKQEEIIEKGGSTIAINRALILLAIDEFLDELFGVPEDDE